MESGEDLPSRGFSDYGLSGKIMMGAMIVLFFVVILMVCLHLYARWYLLRARRRRQRMRHRSRLVFGMDTHSAAPPGPSASLGLDAAIMKSLPIFAYSSKTHPEPIDCAVCLSEFEENEAGRILPKCNHSFHIECIDMWFHSHSTCPLCRTPVKADERPENSGDVFISISQQSLRNEPSSSSGSCSDCKYDMEFPVNQAHPSSSLGTSSFGARKKPLEMTSLDIPRRNEGLGRFENESEYHTPVTPSHKSPISRMMSLSFKRIIGRERRGGVSPSGNAVIFSPVGQMDVERGKDEIERHE